MTLSKKSLLVIFPVILLSNLLVAFSVYWVQRHSIEKLEHVNLTQQMSRLQTLFQDDVQFARNLAFSMLNGNAIRMFTREADRDYRVTNLGAKVQEGIQFFSNKKDRFISFAIIQSDLSVGYYFENSDDPFATMPSAQIGAARRLMNGLSSSSDEYVDADGEALIIHSELIDQTTFASPLPTQKQFAFVIQSAVRPKNFMEFRSTLEKDYETPAILNRGSSAVTSDDQAFVQTSMLMPDLSISLALDEGYINRRLRPLTLALAGGASLLSAVSVGLLIFLIRRNITGPIARLDRQVTDVFEGRSDSMPDRDQSGEIGRLSRNIKVLHDGSVEAFKRLQTMSWTDPLTGVSNRAHFHILGEDMIRDASVKGERLDLLFVDLDNFKFVNDTYGHAAGDAALQEFTRRALETLQQTATGGGSRPSFLARLSGDEFAILCSCSREAPVGENTAQALVDLFVAGLAVQGQTYPISASIGIASLPTQASSFTQLVSFADQAMYRAKASGKNGYAVYSDEIAANDLRVKSIEDELRRLDSDAEFELFYMPIVSANRTVKQCEALLRWTSPLLGSVSPEEFIPIAEARGLFTKIDDWLIGRAISEYRELQALFGKDVGLSLNIWSTQLNSAAVFHRAIECLKRHGVPASAIEIELTETFAANPNKTSMAVVRAFHEAGFRIALDKFGSGFTSIRQILDYSADTIKFDREFVAMVGDEQGRNMLRSMIELFHAQGRVVVADGVECGVTQAAMAEIGCDLFQGFGICPPLSLRDLSIWGLRETVANACQSAGERDPDGARSRSLAV